MKSKDIRMAVKNKSESGDGPAKIFRDLGGAVSLPTIKRWMRMLKTTGSINLSLPPGRTRTIRTKASIAKVKRRVNGKRPSSTRKLAAQLKISRTSVQRMLKEDLHYFPYKKTTEPRLTELQKKKRVQFANWVLNNFSKEDTKKWLFSDEKMFDLNGIYNSQNDRVWAPSRQVADERGGVHQKTKFPAKVMIWLGACSEGLTTPVILDNGTTDAERYINEVLPVALKCGNEMLGKNWYYQQDGAKPHTHHLSQQWCANHFPSFISKDRWPPNSPDLNPLDYSIWNQLAQTMDWGKVTNKTTLVNEIKNGVRKIDKQHILHSVLDFTVRLRRLQQNGGDYIR